MCPKKTITRWLIAGIACVGLLSANSSRVAGYKNNTSQLSTVKVFVLAGQSNMEGQGVVDLDHPQHYNGGKGTLAQLMQNSEFHSNFQHLRQPDGRWTTRDDVWIRFKTPREIKRGPLGVGFTAYEGKHHFGPELQFGRVVGDELDEPVLLVKTAWGDKSLFRDFRPPSSGGTVGPCYTQMLDEVNEAIESAPTEFPELTNMKFEISGFVWQQGWNDMVDESARDQYRQNLIHLINDVRRAWNRPNLPVVIGELGNGGAEASENMIEFRKAQSAATAHPPFVGNVAFAETISFARPADQSPNVGHGHHWFGNAESYLLIGEELGRQMSRLLRIAQQPRVLILGDSISMGYVGFVQEMLDDRAFVVRPMRNHKNHENCQGTKYGLQHIDRWLSMGGGRWDVIHFNFGLHDLKHVHPETGKNSNRAEDPEQSPPELYEKQLREIVGKLKSTSAKLIFATTTPVPAGGVTPYRAVDAPKRYNEIASRVMKENGIAINDLYSLVNDRLTQVQQPINVHFKPAGSKLLGEQVANVIRTALEQNDP